jgi:transcriptional regulator with XRE-family HTH domain
MGRKARLRPKHLGGKLHRVRLALGLSQAEMLQRLGYEGVIHSTRISEYELGKNEPPLPIIVEYARAAGICTDALIDDKVDLPAKLPAKPKHTGK